MNYTFTPTVTPALPFQTVGEEIANAILHGIGALCATAGLVLLIVRGQHPLAVVSYSIFAGTMIIMFLASTLYHAIQHKETKKLFRIFDHAAIYLLIAGTYTPFCLLSLRGTLGWTLLGIEWGCACAGITLYAANCRFLKKIELALYLIMGWALVFSWPRLKHAVPHISLLFLACGGLAYTVGTIWYALPYRKNAHVLWHGFVLIGAACHWYAVWFS
jgi:hemolysin III